MSDLADFLLREIAADEEVARAAGGDGWEVVDERKVRWVRNDGNAHGWAAFADLPTATTHIARWDSARVLAECAAKRAVVELHYVQGYDDEDLNDMGYGCAECGWSAEYSDRGGWCPTLRLLAQPYRDRDGYRQEWA
jgi:hypothetical protein